MEPVEALVSGTGACVARRWASFEVALRGACCARLIRVWGPAHRPRVRWPRARHDAHFGAVCE